MSSSASYLYDGRNPLHFAFLQTTFCGKVFTLDLSGKVDAIAQVFWNNMKDSWKDGLDSKISLIDRIFCFPASFMYGIMSIIPYLIVIVTLVVEFIFVSLGYLGACVEHGILSLFSRKHKEDFNKAYFLISPNSDHYANTAFERVSSQTASSR
jgi:hypothetical protein